MVDFHNNTVWTVFYAVTAKRHPCALIRRDLSSVKRQRVEPYEPFNENTHQSKMLPHCTAEICLPERFKVAGCFKGTLCTGIQ